MSTRCVPEYLSTGTHRPLALSVFPNAGVDIIYLFPLVRAILAKRAERAIFGSPETRCSTGTQSTHPRSAQGGKTEK